MAESRKSFILYTDLKDKTKKLSREEKGALLEAILAHVSGEELPGDMSALTELAFDFLKPQLDSDAEAWEEQKLKRTEAGRKGGRESQARRRSGQNKAKSSSASNASSKSSSASNASSKIKQSKANQAVTTTITGTTTVNGTTTVTTTGTPEPEGSVGITPLNPPLEGEGSLTGYPEVDKAIGDFVEQRNLSKKPMSPAALGYFVKELKDMSGGDRGRMLGLLERAISGGWSTIYPEEKARGSPARGHSPPCDDFVQAYIDVRGGFDDET